MLTAREWTGGPDWVDALVAPLAVHGSLVIVRNGTPGDRERRVRQERATIVVSWCSTW